MTGGRVAPVVELWRRRIGRDAEGAVLPTLANLQIILKHAPEFRRRFRMAGDGWRVIKIQPMPWSSPSHEWTPTDSALLRAWLAAHGLGEYTHRDIADAVTAAAVLHG